MIQTVNLQLNLNAEYGVYYADIFMWLSYCHESTLCLEVQNWDLFVHRKSLKNLFNAGVTRNPMHTAVVFDDGQSSSCLTYGQLLASSMAVSTPLLLW